MIYRLWKCCSQDKGGPCVLYPVRSVWDPPLSGVAQWTGLLLWRPSKAFISGYDSERHFSGKSYQLCRNYNPPPPKESKCLKKILTHFFFSTGTRKRSNLPAQRCSSYGGCWCTWWSLLLFLCQWKDGRTWKGFTSPSSHSQQLALVIMLQVRKAEVIVGLGPLSTSEHWPSF